MGISGFLSVLRPRLNTYSIEKDPANVNRYRFRLRETENTFVEDIVDIHKRLVDGTQRGSSLYIVLNKAIQLTYADAFTHFNSLLYKTSAVTCDDSDLRTDECTKRCSRVYLETIKNLYWSNANIVGDPLYVKSGNMQQIYDARNHLESVNADPRYTYNKLRMYSLDNLPVDCLTVLFTSAIDYKKY